MRQSGEGGGRGKLTMTENDKSALAAKLAEMIPPRLSRPADMPVPSPAFRGFHDHLEERRRLAIAETYAERLTVDELSELVRFFESRVGQSFLQTWPVFTEKMQGVFQSINTAVKERPAPSQWTVATSTAVGDSPEIAKWVEQIKQDISK
jgi:hypothetical protein